jgi:hypothetical protein
MALHTPRQYQRCLDTPLAVCLTVQGWLLAQGVPEHAVLAWCQAQGIDPAARLHLLHHPVTTVIGAEIRVREAAQR